MRSFRRVEILFSAVSVLATLAGCNNGIFYSALGNKIQVPQLTISPATATVPANGTTTFSASGGVPPYVFSIISGSGTISATGAYTAPASPGVAIVQVKDKQGTTATAVVNPVTYAVTAVSNPGAQFSGGAASGTFTIANAGSSNGTQTITWTVYASPNPTLGAGSAVVQSSTTPALPSGGSFTIPYAGTWPTPSSATPYYVIASISSLDSAGASLASTSFTLSPAQVDYAVTAVSCTSGATGLPAGAVSGNFTIKNNGPNAGTQNVSWQVYASTTTTLSATPAPVLVASGTTGPLAQGASSASPILFNGVWPLTYANYYLVASVSVQVDQDTNPSNNIMATASPVAVGIMTATEPNDTIAQAFNTGVTLQPGMSISVTGALNSSDPTDFIQFNTGTANTVTFTATWSAAANVTLNVETSSGPIPGATQSTATTTVSLTWTVDTQNSTRYINVVSTGPYPGTYSLIITAN